jgi:hypothetical protein
LPGMISGPRSALLEPDPALATSTSIPEGIVRITGWLRSKVAVLSLAQLSGSSDQMRLRNGAAQPSPHKAEPVAPPPGRNGST